MGLRDLLNKKDRLGEGPVEPGVVASLAGPGFTFIRTDTLSQDIIEPPDHDPLPAAAPSRSPRRSFDVFRSRSVSVSSQASNQSPSKRRLSQRLHLSRRPESSEHVPDNLPAIAVPAAHGRDGDRAESDWERRATMLAGQNERARSRPSTPGSVSGDAAPNPGQDSRPSLVWSQAIDHDFQEAIRLHETGQLERSTLTFARLADPAGANNPLSQVLYGLALRWGQFAPLSCHTHICAHASALQARMGLRSRSRSGRPLPIGSRI